MRSERRFFLWVLVVTLWMVVSPLMMAFGPARPAASRGRHARLPAIWDARTGEAPRMGGYRTAGRLVARGGRCGREHAPDQSDEHQGPALSCSGLRRGRDHRRGGDQGQ